MQAKITLDTYLSILTFTYKNINIAFSISTRIQELQVVFVDQDGYVEFTTNIGTEGLDFLYDVERFGLDEKEIQELTRFFEQATVTDFVVRCTEVSDKKSNVAAIKEQAYMVLSNLAFVFEKQEGCNGVRIYSLHDTKRNMLLCITDDNNLRLVNTNMTNTMMYKGLYVAERNKSTLIQGFLQWENTQNCV